MRLFDILFEDILSSEELGDVCLSNERGTHFLQTCRIGGREGRYHLKYSDNRELKNFGDLQTFIEYLSYKIYSLYPEVSIPEDIHLIYNRRRNSFGLATKSVPGETGRSIDWKDLGRMLSAGVFVDIFLANWDQKPSNVIIYGDKATRIDPGGSLTFRAQGSRKGGAFNPKVGELNTMLDPNIKGGAGRVLRYADFKKAAEVFESVGWGQISSKIDEVEKEVSDFLRENDLSDLLSLWQEDVSQIKDILEKRHGAVLASEQFMSGKAGP